MIVIDDEHRTGVMAEFDSGSYMGTFEITDKRIPHCITDSNRELFQLLEMTIAATIRKVLDNQTTKSLGENQ